MNESLANMVVDRADYIVRHRAWTRARNGGARMRLWAWSPVIVFGLLALIGWFGPTSVIMMPTGLAQYADVARYASWIIGAFVFWTWMGLGAQDRSGIYMFTPMILAFVFGLFFGGFAVVSFQATVFRTVPILATTVGATETEVEVGVQSVSVVRGCKRKCLVARLSGRMDDRYKVRIGSLPKSNGQLILPRPPEGFYVIPSSLSTYGQPVPVKFKGRGNWIGLRVTDVERIAQSPD